MNEIEEIVYFKSEDMRVKDPNSRLQAMIMKLKGKEALIMSHRADSELWKDTYAQLTVQTKELLLEQIRRVLDSGIGGRETYGLVSQLESFMPDMILKPNLAPPPPPATGIMGMTIATRRKKAKDPKTSEADLALLMNDKDELVRDNLLTNKSMPLAPLIAAARRYMDSMTADDNDSWQSTQGLALIARNEAIPADILEEIVLIDAKGWINNVRGNALSNPSFPLDRFESVSKSSEQMIRHCVASCWRAPHHVIKQLMHDKDEDVRERASETYKHQNDLAKATKQKEAI